MVKVETIRTYYINIDDFLKALKLKGILSYVSYGCESGKSLVYITTKVESEE
jgi:hypothetical protein